MLKKTTFLCFVMVLLGLSDPSFTQTIESPETVFGFKMGTDRRLINWQQITGYFQRLHEQSPRVQVVSLGKTTLGRNMIMAIISSEETMAELEKYKSIQKQLARPFDLEEFKADALIQAGKLVFIITLNIHSTEIAASQESVELAYELATTGDARTRKILNNLIILIVPSLNPDGQDMVTKWYLQDVGTEFEGSRMPQKYHHYADHDNNRDWFFFNLIESRNVARVLYHDWYPEIVMDQHQMGSRGARLFLPPYSDPPNPNVPPSLMAGVNMLGKHVVSDLHDQGLTGLVTGTIFNAFFEGTMSKTPLWHNRIGILTEAASVRVASPTFFPGTSLKGMGKDLPEYMQQTNFLAPWPGGWWRLRDIIDYEKAATYSMLDLAATYKDKFKRNFYRLNKKAIEQGKQGGPFAYVIPAKQHDPSNSIELLRRLRIANVDVYQADSDFETSSGRFQAGDFIVPLAQPARAYVKDLMEVQHYPDLREFPGGPPQRPYDVTAWTLPLQFGIEAHEIEAPFTAAMSYIESPAFEPKQTAFDSGWVAAERRFNHSYKLVNYLLSAGIGVYEKIQADSVFPAGTFQFQFTQKDSARLQGAFRKFAIPMRQFGDTLHVRKIKNARIAVYQPWIPWAYDEGWLRLVFDDFGFEYSVVQNDDFKSRSRLKSKYDVLIFGSQSPDWIVLGKSGKATEPVIGTPMVRKQFTGGIGKVGVDKVMRFLNEGGTALFFGKAVDFAIEKLNLPATNVLKKAKRDEYFAPGSFFEMQLDLTSPLSRGLRKVVSIYKNSPVVLQLKPYSAEIRETGFFAARNVLQSGWAIGEKKLYRNVALAEIPIGQGTVVLYAFRPQHRGQTYGTFKLIFNTLYRDWR